MSAHPTARRTDWAHTPERSNKLMLRVMTWISLRLGRRVARGVLHLIAAYFLLFARPVGGLQAITSDVR